MAKLFDMSFLQIMIFFLTSFNKKLFIMATVKKSNFEQSKQTKWIIMYQSQVRQRVLRGLLGWLLAVIKNFDFTFMSLHKVAFFERCNNKLTRSNITWILLIYFRFGYIEYIYRNELWQIFVLACPSLGLWQIWQHSHCNLSLYS